MQVTNDGDYSMVGYVCKMDMDYVRNDYQLQ